MVGEFGEVYVIDWGVDAVGGGPRFVPPMPASTSLPTRGSTRRRVR
jgi:hypothetical protein